MKLEIGEYVRLDRQQGINKIINIDEDGYCEVDDILYDEWGDWRTCLPIHELEKDVLKHSLKLVKILEIGDIIILGQSFFRIDSEKMLKYLKKSEEKITSVLTREQFESMKYVVGDK
jgi:hypothetical protein